MEQALYRFRPRQTAQITTLRAILTPLFSCCTIAQCAGAQLASLAERNFSFAAQVRRPQISLSEKQSAVTYKKWNEMRPLYRFRPRCEVNSRGEKDQPERKNVLDFAFFLCAFCFLYLPRSTHCHSSSKAQLNKLTGTQHTPTVRIWGRILLLTEYTEHSSMTRIRSFAISLGFIPFLVLRKSSGTAQFNGNAAIWPFPIGGKGADIVATNPHLIRQPKNQYNMTKN